MIRFAFGSFRLDTQLTNQGNSDPFCKKKSNAQKTRYFANLKKKGQSKTACKFIIYYYNCCCYFMIIFVIIIVIIVLLLLHVRTSVVCT